MSQSEEESEIRIVEEKEGSDDSSDEGDQEDEAQHNENDSFAKLGDLLESWGFDDSVQQNFVDHDIDFEMFIHDVEYLNVDKILNGFTEGFKLKLWRRLTDYRSDETQGSKKRKRHSYSSVTNKSELNLSQLLGNTVKGRSFLKLTENNVTTLNPELRKSLIKEIIRLLMEKEGEISMTPEKFQQFADEIVEIFPGERTTNYYLPPCASKKTPGGPFYTRFHYRMARARLEKATKSVSRKKVKREPLDSQKFDDFIGRSVTHEDKVCADVIKKTRNQNEVHEIWDTAFFKRHEDLKELTAPTCADIIRKWPQYRLSIGPTLILKDFEKMFPTKSSNFADQFPLLRKKIMDNLPKNESNAKIKAEYDKTDVEDKKDALALSAIHSMVYTSRLVKNRSKASEKWAFSIVDSQNAVVHIVNSLDDLDRDLKERQKRRQKFGLPPQPLIIVVKSLLEAEQYIIKFDDINYEFSSILLCFDVLFKLFFVFNLQYPEEAKNFFVFIQKLFYQMNLSSDPVCSKISSQLSQFENAE